MRILHVIPSLDPAAGGPPMIAARLAAAQAGLGHHVAMICYQDPAQQEKVSVALRSVPHFEQVRVVALPPPSKWEKITGSASRPALARAIAEADVVHLHSIWESILRAASIEARRQGKPYFILLNGMLDPWSLRQKALKKKVALALGYRRMLNGAAALHLGNADEQELIRPLGLKPPGVIIPNGVFLEELSPLPPRGSFYAARPQLQGRPFILFLSRVHYKKGLDILADAFAVAARHSAELQLVVAGPDGGAKAPFEARIAALGLTDRVHVVGPLYGEEKLAAFVDAGCFCLPSHQEGFSMAITEALACGVPAVISEGCHFPEVADAGAGEVLPLDPRQFGEALARVMSDEALRKRMSDAGRQLIESRYTWPRIAGQTVEAYRRCGG